VKTARPGHFTEDDLAELAQKLEGFQMSGKNHPKSTNVEEIILTKRSTTGNDMLVGGAGADTFSFGNPFTAVQARQITPQRPITVGATLFASF